MVKRQEGVSPLWESLVGHDRYKKLGLLFSVYRCILFRFKIHSMKLKTKNYHVLPDWLLVTYSLSYMSMNALPLQAGYLLWGGRKECWELIYPPPFFFGLEHSSILNSAPWDQYFSFPFLQFFFLFFFF